MSSAPNKTSRPVMGQRPMFGGGSPAFARMPSYTPVTRGQDQAPARPEPQPAPYPPQAAPAYPSANPIPPQPYPNGRQQAPSQPYGGAPQAYPAGNAYPPQGQGNAYPSQGQGNPYPPQGQGNIYPGQTYSGQGYAAPSYAPQSYPAQPYPQESKREESFDSNFADSNFGDARYPDASFPEQNFSEPGFSPSGFAGYAESAPQTHADASFPETGYTEDASFPEDTSYAGAYPHSEPLNLDGGYGQPQAYQPYNDPGQHGGMAPQGGQPQSDPHRALQPFDAPYDQPPQISLGGEQARRGAHGFYEDDQSDADFLDDGDAVAAAAAQSARKGGMTLRSRSMFMVGSALLGAVALGGALAFAYKQSGGAMNGDQPPLVQADNRPVKEVPDQPGGKDFPHKNKLIYDRLENGDKPETDHLVPRQEEVAMPAMPGSGGETAGLPAAPAQAAPPTTEAVDGTAPPPSVATVDDPEGGPRRVKTMVVRPDGSMAPPPGVEAAAASAPQAAPAQQVASAQVPGIVAAAAPAQPAPQPAPAPAPQPAPAPVAAAAVPEPQQVASIPAPAPVKPKPVKAAAAEPAAPAKASAYVVQVGSKKNQTEALATFADMQQKYPTLLSSYRPMVQKADLGSKGVWYRLRIGPMNDKTAASKLCTQLKSQGLSYCLVMTE